MVQLPLPDQIDSEKILQAIDPEKDVDGFHPFNVGKMVVGEPVFLPCTPYAIQQMLVRSGIETDGKAYRRIAKEIREMDRDPIIAAYEVGSLGFFSRGKIFDLVGQVTPSVVEAKRENPDIDPLTLTDAKWFVHPFYVSEFESAKPAMDARVKPLGFVPVSEHRWEWDGPGITVVYRRVE